MIDEEGYKRFEYKPEMRGLIKGIGKVEYGILCAIKEHIDNAKDNGESASITINDISINNKDYYKVEIANTGKKPYTLNDISEIGKRKQYGKISQNDHGRTILINYTYNEKIYITTINNNKIISYNLGYDDVGEKYLKKKENDNHPIKWISKVTAIVDKNELNIDDLKDFITCIYNMDLYKHTFKIYFNELLLEPLLPKGDPLISKFNYGPNGKDNKSKNKFEVWTWKDPEWNGKKIYSKYGALTGNGVGVYICCLNELVTYKEFYRSRDSNYFCLINDVDGWFIPRLTQNKLDIERNYAVNGWDGYIRNNILPKDTINTIEGLNQAFNDIRKISDNFFSHLIGSNPQKKLVDKTDKLDKVDKPKLDKPDKSDKTPSKRKNGLPEIISTYIKEYEEIPFIDLKPKKELHINFEDPLYSYYLKNKNEIIYIFSRFVNHLDGRKPFVNEEVDPLRDEWKIQDKAIRSVVIKGVNNAKTKINSK